MKTFKEYILESSDAYIAHITADRFGDGDSVLHLGKREFTTEKEARDFAEDLGLFDEIFENDKNITWCSIEDYLGNISLDNWNNQLLRFRVRNIPIGTTTKGRDNVLSSFTNAKAKCVGKVLEFKPDKRDTGWWSKVGGKWDDQWFHEDWLEPIDENLYEAIEDELDNESSRRYFKVKNIKQGTLIRVPGGPLIDFGGEKVDNIGKILSFEPIIEGWWNNKNWYYHESWLEEV